MSNEAVCEAYQIRLLPVKYSDTSILYDKVYSDRNIVEPAGFYPYHSKLQMYIRIFLNKINPRVKSWCIVYNTSLCGVIKLSLVEQYYNIGIMLSKDSWGLGIASSALNLVLISMGDIKGRKYRAVVKKNNIKSINVFIGLGFKILEETSENVSLVRNSYFERSVIDENYC